MLVRLADTQDCRDILEWRNDELTRKMSFEGGIVDYASHKAWFDHMRRRFLISRGYW